MSATYRKASTRYRAAYKAWEQGIGQQYIQHTPGKPNYLRREGGTQNDARSAQRGLYRVFPKNDAFFSQPVLSEELKEAIWKAVVEQGRSIRQTSIDYQVDIRRAGAVVRLKELEKQWVENGKQLATPYSKAVMEMLPQTPLQNPPVPHEPVNDLDVHRSTLPQLFWPVPEAQHFTRVEAGQAFKEGLLPAEARIPHPQLYSIAKATARGIEHKDDINIREWKAIEEKDIAAYQRKQSKVEDREARTTTVQTPRWAFKFESVTVDRASVGKFVDGIGQRYGMPHEDRKKGQVKIPTKVDG